MMHPFVQRMCNAGFHCHICRDKDGCSGEAHREGLFRKGFVDCIDFDCPQGIPWNPTSEQLPTQARPKPIDPTIAV